MQLPNSLLEQYELIKEIHFVFENIEPKIKGRIYKITLGPTAEFSWEVNYYCKLEDEGSVYIPGSSYGQNLEDTERKLFQYIKRFEKAVDWKINSQF